MLGSYMATLSRAAQTQWHDCFEAAYCLQTAHSNALHQPTAKLCLLVANAKIGKTVQLQIGVKEAYPLSPASSAFTRTVCSGP